MIVGTAVGICTHAVLAGVGLAALVMQSAELYRGLRIVGALYLLVLGSSLMWRSCRATDDAHRSAADSKQPRGLFGQVRTAFTANVLNVKAATVYLTLAPQFIPAAEAGVQSMLLLAATHVLVMALWLGAWSVGLATLAARFDARRWQRRIDMVGGAVLALLGIRTASEAQ